jgi:hypothetical protein
MPPERLLLEPRALSLPSLVTSEIREEVTGKSKKSSPLKESILFRNKRDSLD